MKNEPRVIDGNASLLLDSLRITAALTVLIFHAYDQWYPSSLNTTGFSGKAAHEAVIVFFVLSGYLIAHATSRLKNPLQYAQARLSRLCSVVIPALLITFILQILVIKISPELAAHYIRGSSWPRYLISAGFLNEIWMFSSAPPMNSPLWSLSYEFWYYAIFGLWIYKKAGWKGLLLPLLACLIAGPKILLLMPVWLAGSIAYKFKAPFKGRIACFFIFAAIIISIIGMIYIPIWPRRIGVPPFFFSNQFVTDYVLGIFVAIALWCLPSGTRTEKKPKWILFYRNISDLTFPIYVLHYPLLVFWRSLFGFKVNNALQMWEAIGFALALSLLMGAFFEHKRPTWANYFKWQLNWMKNLVYKKQIDN
jgi:peptidoglycan/LPS O-acetylase OafA/YrhL